MLRKLLALAAAAVCLVVAAPSLAATTQAPLQKGDWTFDGPLGHYDQEQLQRGFKVYREVCSQCHSLNLIAFHNLGDPGAPFWSPNPKYKNSNDNPWVKSISADYKVSDIDPDTGDPIKRTATSADTFPPPFPNDAAARASNGGALPPDMSLLEAAREDGPNYILSLMQGFVPAPAGLQVPAGKYYNEYYPGDLSSYWKGDPAHVPPGGFISMPPPLTACKVTFDDAKPCAIKNEAADVTAFLTWASDPKMEERKNMGVAVMIYLVLFSGILWLSYKRVWRYVAH